MAERKYNETMIRDFLEKCYSGARMEDDEELKTRIARALVAFDFDIEDDQFLPDVMEKVVEKDCTAARTELERQQKEKETDEWDKIRKRMGISV